MIKNDVSLNEEIDPKLVRGQGEVFKENFRIGVYVCGEVCMCVVR